MGIKGRKRIIGNLWFGRGDLPDQGRLPGIGLSDQPHIRQHLHLQAQIARFPRRPPRGLARCAVSTAFKPGIAQPMDTPFRHQQLVTGLDQITDQLARLQLIDARPQRHVDQQVIGGFADAVSAHARLTVPGAKQAGMAKIHQGIQTFVHHQVDTAAVTAVTAVRAAAGDIFLPPETEAAVPSFAGLDPDDCFVYEFHFPSLVICQLPVVHLTLRLITY